MYKPLIILTLFTSPVFAETSYITIPDEGWHLKIDGPALTASKLESDGRLISYFASNVKNGISVSINTELNSALSNQACFDTYWARAKKNPTFIKGSESLFKSEIANFVTLQSEGKYQGNDFKMANAHAYFVNDGLCVDLHISHWPYNTKSDQFVKNIVQSISIVK